MITGQTVKNTYQGDGVNREFTITFEFTDSSQVKFKVNGEEVTTNYALNSVSKTLTYPTVASELDPLTSADEIEIYRDTEITQDIEFNNGGPLNADMIEDGLDKLTMISQEIKHLVVGDGTNIKELGSADIDGLKEEGEFFVRNASCTSGFPDDLKTTQESYGEVAPSNGKCAYVKVIPTNTGDTTYPTVKVTQICIFYTKVSMPDNIASFRGVYIRTYKSGSGYPASWEIFTNLLNLKRKVDCGINYDSTPYMPDKVYPNTTYILGDLFGISPATLSSLTLSDLPDSSYPIEFIFKTGNSFSGITATQIKAWIGNTTLDANSVYKITIENLIGKIEKLTVVE